MFKKTMLCMITLTMLLLYVCPVSAQANTITSITFANANAVAEENLSVSGYGDKESGYASSTNGGRLYASVSGTDLRKLEWSKGEYGEYGMQPVMTGGTKNPWGNGAYFELRTSSKGYENLTFSAKIGSTKKGPRDFTLQFSIDGIRFQDIAGTDFSVTTNKTLYNAFDNVALPADADNADTLYIRIAVTTNFMTSGTAGLIGSTGGEVAINDILLCGDPIPAPTATTANASTTTDTITTNTPTSSEQGTTFSRIDDTTNATTVANNTTHIYPTTDSIVAQTTLVAANNEPSSYEKPISAVSTVTNITSVSSQNVATTPPTSIRVTNSSATLSTPAMTTVAPEAAKNIDTAESTVGAVTALGLMILSAAIWCVTKKRAAS